MDILSFFGIITCIYLCLYFIDQFLKSCMNFPYFYLLENTGLSIQPFYINIFSTIFNRQIIRFSLSNQKFLSVWFSIGSVFVIGIFIPSILLLLWNLITQLFSTQSVDQVLVAVVPGLNLPKEDILCYFIALALASIFHEFGHASAAAGQDVHINGVGFMLLFVLPGAFVEIAQDSVVLLKPLSQLKIYCAGIWHNIILVLFAVSCWQFVLPICLSGFYDTNAGVLVLKVEENSPVSGVNGLQSGDVINSINGCPISNFENWRECLIFAAKNQTSFCASKEFVTYHDESTTQDSFYNKVDIVDCCDKGSDSSTLCFELKLDERLADSWLPMQQHSCLPVRLLLEKSDTTCYTTSDCVGEENYCLMPLLNRATQLLHIPRKSVSPANRDLFLSKDEISGFSNFGKNNVRNSEQTSKNFKILEKVEVSDFKNIDLDYFRKSKDVVYLGPVSDLYFNVKLTNYVPKYNWVSHWLPHNLELALDYLVKFSSALGLMNLIPCFYLDGYWISKILVNIFCDYFRIGNKKYIHISINVFGTVLLSSTILIGVFKLF